MSKKSKAVESSTSSTEIYKKSIDGRLTFRKSKESPFEWCDTFEKLMKYVDSRIEEANFQKALEILKLKGGERILDFGASMCWASYAFSKKGCATVAVDFDMNDTYGVLAGKKLIENTGVTFELVAGDCEQIPLKDGYFDIAFGSQVLHHAEDLNKTVSEVARVTKMGGVVIAIDEPKRGLFQSEEKLKKRNKAVPFGVNEHFPSYFQYMSAFKKAGLVDIDMFPSGEWNSLEEQINKVDNYLKRYAYKGAYKLLRIPLIGRIIRKAYLTFCYSSIIIIAKKK